MSQSVAFLLLAAGQSKRLGRPKQLEPFQGKSLIRFMAEQILGVQGVSGDQVWALLGAEKERVEHELAGLGLRTAFNPKFREGMGGGISLGLSAMLGFFPDLEACLVCVCDQTGLRTAHLEKMLATHLEHPA
ncbi:MAG: NTP transferase domain-containing protein, partial [Spirochaetia bacterium]|nr:NTP transferase domain-containing protein [Spirochaetia bacterium]